MNFWSHITKSSLLAALFCAYRQSCVKSRSARGGFSLIEVTFALGIVSFGVLSIVGVMGVGLITLKDARAVQTQATIVAHVRGKLQQMSLTEVSGPKSLNTFVATPMYFTSDGIPTDTTTADLPPYYTVSMVKADAEVDGGDGSPLTFLTRNAQTVKVSITYPYGANTTTNDIPLLLARQRQ
ncbi:hypothetical protein DB346_09090 [Verrucomicrobia bacterium LW23]|nr:hypothetical protein DB346_09090 [Verrucomicrobia bacterium LW23]